MPRFNGALLKKLIEASLPVLVELFKKTLTNLDTASDTKDGVTPAAALVSETDDRAIEEALKKALTEQ